jgi:[ribosomal protein S5]-alanine N-acetyltransferase
MIETERLLIKPLSYAELLTYLEASNKLEKEWQLRFTGRTVSPDVKKMVKELTLPKIVEASLEDQIFYTFWIVVDKVSNSIVAELGFKGPPNEKGEIEIGYGTMPSQQGKGYMTEAVSGMLQWAAGRNEVKYILAAVDKNNKPSIRIVEKNEFECFEEKENLLWWKKSV